MTNDYYINLANYYTNQLSIGTGVESITLNVDNLNYYSGLDLDSYFTNTLGATDYTLAKWLTWDGSNNLVAYGEVEIGGNYKNYILRVPYLNNTYDMTNAEIYTTYVGGTDLPYFWDLIVDNDGSLYGIVSSGTYFALIMLGNPFITGGIKFRQSYALPTTYSEYYNYQKVIKKENSGEYLIMLNDGGAKTLIYHLTINVGGTNDWVATTANYFLNMYDYYISWGNSISLNMLSYDDSTEYGPNYNATFEVYNYNGSSITLMTSYTGTLGINTHFRVRSAKYYDENNFYYIVSYLTNYSAGSGTSYNILYKGNLLNSSSTIVKSISTSYSSTSPYTTLSYISNRQQVEIINGIVYFKFFTLTGASSFKNLYGVVVKNIPYTVYSTITQGEPLSVLGNFLYFLVEQKYNIYKIVMPLSSSIDVVEFQYDPNGYNGTAYIDTNMFIPYRMELYNNDSPAVLLFDRGLYNLKVYGNVTESTFNVPNTMLNNEVIYQTILYGETNYSLVNDLININKNIYENLMINFFNSIVVKDYTGRIYNSGGSRVNDSISKTNDIVNASANKIKLFNNDSTTFTYLLPTPTIVGSGKPMTITYEIPLNVASDGYVLKYQILSNDENTLYFEYDTSSLNVGTYKITQKCSVE